MDPMNVPATFEVRSFTRSSDNSEWVVDFGGGIANPKSWGRGGGRRVSGWHGSKER